MKFGLIKLESHGLPEGEMCTILCSLVFTWYGLWQTDGAALRSSRAERQCATRTVVDKCEKQLSSVREAIRIST